MNFLSSLVGGNIFSFKGRINRLTFWVINLITGIPILKLSAPILEPLAEGNFNHGLSGSQLFLTSIALIFLSWINLAATVKRFHDRGKSGYWYFMSMVPFIGAFWILIDCGFISGDEGENEFGLPQGAGLDESELRPNTASRAAQFETRFASAPAAAPVVTAHNLVAAGAKPVFGRRK
jgi:uncharacterized membrane protein YhaH (DUF805 family)